MKRIFLMFLVLIALLTSMFSFHLLKEKQELKAIANKEKEDLNIKQKDLINKQILLEEQTNNLDLLKIEQEYDKWNSQNQKVIDALK